VLLDGNVQKLKQRKQIQALLKENAKRFVRDLLRRLSSAYCNQWEVTKVLIIYSQSEAQHLQKKKNLPMQPVLIMY
jgi:hypothetical protein